MTRLINLYFSFLEAVVACCLAIMIVLVFGNVVLRYAFDSGITVSEELSRWLFVWLTFLGAIVALREHGHLGVDTLVKRLPRKGKQTCLIVSQGLMLYATILFFQGSWVQTLINWDVTAPASGLSAAWLYGVGLVFSVSTGLIILNELRRALTGDVSDADLVTVKESEEQEQLERLERELQERDRRFGPANASSQAAKS